MIDFLHRIKSGFFILLIQSIICSFALSFLPLYFKTQGYSLYAIILLYALYSGFVVVFIPIIKTFHLRKYLQIGFVIYALMSLILLIPGKYTNIVAYAFLMSWIYSFFRIPINYLYFNNSHKETNALNSSFYMTTFALVSIIMPPLGALVIKYWGFHWLYLIAAVLFLIPILVVRKYVHEQVISAPFWLSITQFSKLKTLTFFEGGIRFYARCYYSSLRSYISAK